MVSYNVAQLTNFDMQNEDEFKIETINNQKYAICDFRQMLSKTIKITKLGYCCEPKGIGTYIYIFLYEQNDDLNLPLSLSAKAIPILIGPSGMYEIQPETFIKTNNENIAEEVEMKVNIVGIGVPIDLKFTIDYAYNN